MAILLTPQTMDSHADALTDLYRRHVLSPHRPATDVEQLLRAFRLGASCALRMPLHGSLGDHLRAVEAVMRDVARESARDN